MIFWKIQDTRELQISILLSHIAIGQPMDIVNLPPIWGRPSGGRKLDPSEANPR